MGSTFSFRLFRDDAHLRTTTRIFPHTMLGSAFTRAALAALKSSAPSSVAANKAAVGIAASFACRRWKSEVAAPPPPRGTPYSQLTLGACNLEPGLANGVHVGRNVWAWRGMA